ncbi:hypothetical protein D8S78_00320 [Natrialba swarupiae]|nr:hypothetical protein [Natrialba swarupiae]
MAEASMNREQPVSLAVVEAVADREDSPEELEPRFTTRSRPTHSTPCSTPSTPTDCPRVSSSHTTATSSVSRGPGGIARGRRERGRVSSRSATERRFVLLIGDGFI